MIIKKLYLKNYRNYEEILLELDKGVNFIIGNNAQGKTNLLESIYFASVGKSFRTRKDLETVKHSSSFSSMKYIVEDKGIDTKIDILISSDNRKAVKINDHPITKISELFGYLNVVLFSPNQMSLLRSGPSERRSFLDREISLINKGYLEDLIKYNKLLDIRNKLLKERIKDYESYEIWDSQLSEIAYSISRKRRRFIKDLNVYGIERTKQISSENDRINVLYNTNIGENAESLKAKLKDSLDKDLELKYTSVGVHRDDFTVLVNGKDAKKFASQGQVRTITLSLVLSEADIIRSELGKSAVILLDDVFSELDETRKNNIISSLKDHQIIITSTDIKGIDKQIIDKSRLIEIDDGKLK